MQFCLCLLLASLFYLLSLIVYRTICQFLHYSSFIINLVVLKGKSPNLILLCPECLGILLFQINFTIFFHVLKKTCCNRTPLNLWINLSRTDNFITPHLPIHDDVTFLHLIASFLMQIKKAL